MENSEYIDDVKSRVYNRNRAEEYARKFALSRNPAYLNFDLLGGDCTNFCSQCLFAGCGQMNFNRLNGWYYKNGNNKSPSWTDVNYLYQFLTTNKGPGPFGHDAKLSEITVGDIIQLSFDGFKFQHSLFVLSTGNPPGIDNIKIACHTSDRLDYNLNNFFYFKSRYIHIDGFR